MGKSRKIDTAVLRRMWNDGASIEAICDHFECSQSAISQAVKRIGLLPRDKRSLRLPIDPVKLAEMWADGMTCDDIGLVLGCSASNISRTAKEMGLEARINRPASLTKAQIARAFESGKSVASLARELGCHENTLRTHMKRYAIAPPTHDVPPPEPPVDRPDLATLTGRLLATKGRYEALEAVRKAEGWTTSQAMQRYHRARAGV